MPSRHGAKLNTRITFMHLFNCFFRSPGPVVSNGKHIIEKFGGADVLWSAVPSLPAGAADTSTGTHVRPSGGQPVPLSPVRSCEMSTAEVMPCCLFVCLFVVSCSPSLLLPLSCCRARVTTRRPATRLRAHHLWSTFPVRPPVGLHFIQVKESNKLPCLKQKPACFPAPSRTRTCFCAAWVNTWSSRRDVLV
jgi:hypothetical protein